MCLKASKGWSHRPPGCSLASTLVRLRFVPFNPEKHRSGKFRSDLFYYKTRRNQSQLSSQSEAMKGAASIGSPSLVLSLLRLGNEKKTKRIAQTEQ